MRPDRTAIPTSSSCVSASPCAEVRAIERGRADWMADAIASATVVRARTRYSAAVAQLGRHRKQTSCTSTPRRRRSTFRVRQALNYAIDRRAIVRLYGGSDAAAPTRQVLPPGVVGYRRYCPYTRHPNAQGVWTAPDLVTARRLVLASGTRGQRVTVWAARDAGGPVREVVTYTVQLLRRLGYRARSHFVLFFLLWQRRPDDVSRDPHLGACTWTDNTALRLLVTWSACAAAYNHRLVFRSKRRPHDRSHAGARKHRSARCLHLLGQARPKLVDRAAWVPLVNPRQIEFVSKRVRNHEHHALLGIIVDQLQARRPVHRAPSLRAQSAEA